MKNPFRSLLILGILILNSSCTREFSTTELQNNFSEEQINDLKKITYFFKSQICENKTSDFKTCFSKILPELLTNGWQPIIKNVDFVKQKELYASILQSTFNEIWVFVKTRRYNYEEKFKSIGSKGKGKYLDFLNDVSKNNPQVKIYYDALLASGDFDSTLSLQNQIFDYPKEFDLDNPNIQLIITIHYLSQNDNVKRIEKWESE
jgi:hypothetical protein